MDNLCNKCIHKDVCSRWAATWGVNRCEHFMEAPKKGKWEIRKDDCGNELMWCPICQSEFYDGDNDTVDQTPNYCPNCGADMRGKKNG